MAGDLVKIAGRYTNFKHIDGALKTIVDGIEVGDILIEAPGVNTEYDSVEGMINPATTTSLGFTAVTTAYNMCLANDGTTNIQVKINGLANNAMTVRPGEDRELTEFRFTSVHVINALTTSCSYRLAVLGV